MAFEKVPTTLKREPLVDAVFEVRFDGSAPLADLLPGVLFNKLDPKPSISRLPAAEIPQPVRSSDPAWHFVPTQRLEWGAYFISLGDRNVVVSCKLPYPKWPSFRQKILEIMNFIRESGVAGKVERFSVKYTNLIEAPSIAEQISKIEMAIRIGALEVQQDHVDMKVHRVDGDVVHILSVITGASGKLYDGRAAFGVVLDIDSIRNIQPISFDEFARGLEPNLEKLRQANKRHFFSCLKPSTTQEMEPTYE